MAAQPLMTIDGAPARSPGAHAVLNPADGTVVGHAPRCSTAQLDEAMEAAARAFASWRRDDEARAAALERASEAVFGGLEELAALLTAEQGKPLAEARGEVKGAALWLRHFARVEAEAPAMLKGRRGAGIEVRRRPFGVVAAITPWNAPIGLATWKIGPGLRAGNTIVLKPSDDAPLSTLRLGELLRDVFPPGVLNVISGDDELGRAMTVHPVPRKVSFTGSVAAGQSVARNVAIDLKRMTLELGGNDAAIVLDDADPEAIAEALFWGALANCGQTCAAIKRLYVPEPLYDDMVDALAERAARTQVGDGAVEGTELGPLTTAAQLHRVRELVEEAVARGARPLQGSVPGGEAGHFHAPTILADARDGMRVVDEEQFGPVLPVLSYANLDDAIARANATTFGLGASVWTTDRDRAGQVADRLHSGTVWVNAHQDVSPQQPFGGVKRSGIGVENGTWGLDAFTELQVFHEGSSWP